MDKSFVTLVSLELALQESMKRSGLQEQFNLHDRGSQNLARFCAFDAWTSGDAHNFEAAFREAKGLLLQQLLKVFPTE